MFKSLKIYAGQVIATGNLAAQLVDFGYKRQEKTAEEGDFSLRGHIIDIFPFTFELPIRIELDIDKVSSIKTFNPDTGENLWEHKISIVLPIKKIRPSRPPLFKEDFPVDNFVDLNTGDYVVHTQHGVGRFLGFDKDHLMIEYENQEKLYVPVEAMHLVQKYIAFKAKRPRLQRLGTKEWQRIKDKARRGIQKLAWDLLSLEAMRLTLRGFAFSRDTEWQREFEASFPYQETPDQIKAAEEVKQDMESIQPMNRLLCGDVGYGKTEVAMRAAFKAVMDNKQVAYLVPTTILAEQHYQTFLCRIGKFPVNVAMLSRFKTKGEQKAILKAVAQGNVDIIIGTHRLLSDDVRFKDLGVVIIDEEQRFGVKAKEKLKAIRLNTDLLTLTATPIPRTLYMSLMGAKALSQINTPPQNRLPIKTIVVEYDEDLIRQAILRELSRKGQVYFVHNRIYDIAQVRKRLEKTLPENIRLAVAHGRMEPLALEQVMSDFLRGKIDCLISTMIIETGIDIPNVNTIIIDDAHAFGLADLHQLRGRVGRFDKPAYAYLLVPPNKPLEAEAAKRLSAIQEYTQLGAGFKIAMEDLEIRGAGNLLGIQQHGFIQAIGFDLYCRLLREAISSFKKVMADA